MKKKVLVLAFAALIVASPVIGATSAQAAESSCPSQDFCLWDPQNWSGSPTVYKGAYNIIGGTFAVTPRVTGSGANHRGIGKGYCGFDDLGYEQGYWPINTSVSLLNAQNNSITYIYYGTEC